MKYKAIIIDDEPKLQEVLKVKIHRHCPDVEIVDTALNAQQGYDSIQEHDPQIVFLDIAMPGESGFELLNRYDNFSFEIIFVTGFSEFAIRALRASAVDYLLKPIMTSELIKATEKAKERIINRQKIEQYDELKQNIVKAGKQLTKISIPGSNAYELVETSTILRCEGWKKYTRIFLTNGEVIVSSYSLGVFFEILKEYNFFRTHKSHVINSKMISRYQTEGMVEMTDGSKVPVSRRKREEFVKTFIK